MKTEKVEQIRQIINEEIFPTIYGTIKGMDEAIERIEQEVE